MRRATGGPMGSRPGVRGGVPGARRGLARFRLDGWQICAMWCYCYWPRSHQRYLELQSRRVADGVVVLHRERCPLSYHSRPYYAISPDPSDDHFSSCTFIPFRRRQIDIPLPYVSSVRAQSFAPTSSHGPVPESSCSGQSRRVSLIPARHCACRGRAAWIEPLITLLSKRELKAAE